MLKKGRQIRESEQPYMSAEEERLGINSFYMNITVTVLLKI